MKARHNIDPIYDKNSKILMLGSMLSVTSRNAKFFYAHPQNRFWKIMEIIFNVSLPTIQEKKEFLLEHNIALWDVVFSCEITGSSDSSIKEIVPNDIEKILNYSPIKCIFCNGKKSYELFNKFFKTDIPVVCLPSPSSANATYSLDKLVSYYKKILEFLED